MDAIEPTEAEVEAAAKIAYEASNNARPEGARNCPPWDSIGPWLRQSAMDTARAVIKHDRSRQAQPVWRVPEGDKELAAADEAAKAVADCVGLTPGGDVWYRASHVSGEKIARAALALRRMVDRVALLVLDNEELRAEWDHSSKEALAEATRLRASLASERAISNSLRGMVESANLDLAAARRDNVDLGTKSWQRLNVEWVRAIRLTDLVNDAMRVGLEECERLRAGAKPARDAIAMLMGEVSEAHAALGADDTENVIDAAQRAGATIARLADDLRNARVAQDVAEKACESERRQGAHIAEQLAAQTGASKMLAEGVAEGVREVKRLRAKSNGLVRKLRALRGAVADVVRHEYEARANPSAS